MALKVDVADAVAVSDMVRGIWLSMKYGLEQLLAGGSAGAIVNAAPVGGLIGIPGAGSYTASKGGILGLTKVAALEYATHGIRANAGCPSLTDTPTIRHQFRESPHLEEKFSAGGPSARMGHSEEIAQPAVWLRSRAASFANGFGMPVDGGRVAQ